MSRRIITGLLLLAAPPIAAGCAGTPADTGHAGAPATAGTPAYGRPWTPAPRLGWAPAIRPGPPPASPAWSAVSPSAPMDDFTSSTDRDTAFSLPMRVVTNGGGTLVYVPVRVNGEGPYEFVLDTGSSNSSVDRTLVQRLGLPRTGREHRVQGVTGSGLVPIVKVRHWSIGGVSLHDRSLAVVDLGMGVAGLLGSDELRHFGSVTLDFAHGRAVFHHR